MTFEGGLERQLGVQQVGRWKGLNQEHKEAEAWRPVDMWSLDLPELLDPQVHRRQGEPAAPRGCPGAAEVEPCLQSGSKNKKHSFFAQ